MSSGEVWRDVPGVPEILASSEGRVMHIPHRRPMPRDCGVWSKTDARFIIRVRGRTYKVARLVAEAFSGLPPFDGAVVMHLDENANNRASNLRWGTQKENLNAPGFLEYCRSRTGENHPKAKAPRDKAAR